MIGRDNSLTAAERREKEKGGYMRLIGILLYFAIITVLGIWLMNQGFEVMTKLPY